MVEELHMTDTSKAVERFDLDVDFHGDVTMEKDPRGDFVRYSDYAALSAQLEEWKEAAQRHHPNPADYRYWEGRYRDEKSQLEAANARARDDALVEVAEEMYQRFYPKNDKSDWTDYARTHAAVATEARYAIQALRTKPTPKASVEPVTVQQAFDYILSLKITPVAAPLAGVNNGKGMLMAKQAVRAALRAIAGEKP